MEWMQIKELAEKLNVSPRTIRFYEEKGLIAPYKDERNGYRLFSEKEARRLQTILSLRELGIPVTDIRTVLQQMDRGEPDGVLYALEMQRSLMFSQWVEMKKNMEATDRMIDLFKQKGSLQWEDIFEWTNGLKQRRELRSRWRDHWDFDHQALSHDDRVYADDPQPLNQHPGYKKALQMVVDWVNPQQGEKGLDMGTGTGNLAGRFMERGIEMEGMDQSREMLVQCRHKFPVMKTKIGNFLAVPYLDHTFDFVVTSYALHHLTDKQKLLALEEMQRVLKPHGRICIADLMFECQSSRTSFLAQAAEEDKQHIKDWIEEEYYADRSLLTGWFEANGYLTKTRQIHELVHLIYAVPINPRM